MNLPLLSWLKLAVAVLVAVIGFLAGSQSGVETKVAISKLLHPKTKTVVTHHMVDEVMKYHPIRYGVEDCVDYFSRCKTSDEVLGYLRSMYADV